MLYSEIQSMVEELPGKIGVYYLNLSTGSTFSYNAHEEFLAASIIKLPLLAAVYQEFQEGRLKKDDIIKLASEDKVPGCGVLSMMHDDLEITIADLCSLMISISDNTATNILIKTLGFPALSASFAKLGLKATRLNRLLYDIRQKELGVENYFTPAEMGFLLEQIYYEKLISPEASREMADILANQQINSKIPYLLPSDTKVAHKTGEVRGVTHDVGIIYAKDPFILCFASNETDVICAEEAIRKIALLCYDHSQ